MDLDIIADYKPNILKTPSTDKERGQLRSSSPDPYLEDLEIWGTPPSWVTPTMASHLLPISFDYLRMDIEPRNIIFDHTAILQLKISRLWKLKESYFSTLEIQEVKDFIFNRKRLKVSDEDKVKRTFRPIESGILCGGYKTDDINDNLRTQTEFIIIISAANRRGDPGRLYILSTCSVNEEEI